VRRIVVGIIALVVPAACGGSSKSGSSTTTPPTAAANPAVTTTALNGSDPARSLSWNIAVPQVSGLGSATAQAAINASLTQAAHDQITNFTNTLDEEGPCQADCGSGSTLKCTPGPHFIDARVVSLQSTCVATPAGAAHPSSLPMNATFDATTGSELSLSDLFTPGSDYLTTLSQTARAQLANVYGYDPTAEPGGSSAKADNFMYFMFGNDGFHITFPEYSIGPYALGVVNITIPYAQLASVARANGPLSGR
jgi:hypothetical protein